MSDRDPDFTDTTTRALARLATLQRLRDQMKQGRREAMLRSIEQLIEQESRHLRDLKDRDAEPHP